MKIVILSPLVAPYRVTFYEKLSKLASDFKVFYHVKQNEDGRPQHDKKVNFYTRGFPESKTSFMGFSMLVIKGMFTAIKNEKPDLIILPGIPGNLTYRKIVNWARKSKIKVVFWYCGWEPNKKRFFLLQEIKRILALSFYKKGNYFITYSTKAKDDLIDQKFSPDMIKVALNGIELDDYDNIDDYNVQAIELRKKYSVSSNVFLYVGGLMEEKRVLFLIDAFAEFNSKHRETQLWVIGDGPQRMEVEEKIAGYSFIKYFGRIIENVEPYFVAADYFVLPGTGGLAINQAMFFETPCIVGRADGTEKDLVVENVTGFNFIEDNKESLVSKLEEAQNLNAEQLKVMKKKGKEIIVKKSNVNSIIEVFDDVLGELTHN
jgi:glycosyltransferase involved in cell wall biosynthesis